MMEIGLRPAVDVHQAADAHGAPVACRAIEPSQAFVREGEVWLSYPTWTGAEWLVTASAGSPLHRPDDLEGAAIMAAGIFRIGNADPWSLPAPEWGPGDEAAVPVVGADLIVYAARGGDAVVLAVVPVAAAPPPMFSWLAPAA